MTSRFDQQIDRLVAADAVLAAVVSEHGRPVPFDRPPTFDTLVLLILEQQVSLDSARAAYNRLAAATEVAPQQMLDLTDDELRTVGFSRQKSRYVRGLSERVADGRLDISRLAGLSDDDVRRELTSVPGIGPWTADVFLMSGLGRPDIWPIGDRALQVATREALDLAEVPTPEALSQIGERWRPYRTAAAHILWHGYLGRRNRAIPR